MKSILLSQIHQNEKIFETSGESTLETARKDSPIQSLDWETVQILNDETFNVEGYILRPQKGNCYEAIQFSRT